MNNCEEYIELLSAFYDGELSEQDMHRVEEHVLACADCAALLEVYKEISAAAQDSLVPVPESLCENVMAEISNGEVYLAPKRTRERITWKRALTRYVPAAACLAVILLALPRLEGLGCKSGAPLSGGVGMNEKQTSMMDMAQAPAGETEDDADYGGFSVESRNGVTEYPYAAAEDAAPQESGELEIADEPPAAPSSAPQTAGGGENTSDGIKLPGGLSAEEYYAVITITGELPKLLEGLEYEDGGVSVRYIYISRETAQELIAAGLDGIETELITEDAESAVVVYVP